MCSWGSPIWLGTRREPGRAGAKPGGAGQGGGPFAVAKERERTLGPVLFPWRQRLLFVSFSQTLTPPWRDHPGLTYPEPDLVP